jgi:hypothetical protein
MSRTHHAQALGNWGMLTCRTTVLRAVKSAQKIDQLKP